MSVSFCVAQPRSDVGGRPREVDVRAAGLDLSRDGRLLTEILPRFGAGEPDPDEWPSELARRRRSADRAAKDGGRARSARAVLERVQVARDPRKRVLRTLAIRPRRPLLSDG